MSNGDENTWSGDVDDAIKDKINKFRCLRGTRSEIPIKTTVTAGPTPLLIWNPSLSFHSRSRWLHL